MKKNLLVTLTACILVACLAVGGTVAFMSAGDKAVVNTFTFADGMVVDIYETAPSDTSTATIGQATYTTSGNTGDLKTGRGYYEAINYQNVLPGQTLPKTPFVAVKTTVDAYVFIKIVENEYVTHDTVTWDALPGVDNVYYKLITIDPTDTDDIYEIEDPIFKEVTIAADLDPADFTDGDLGDIKIGVSMIQKSGFTSPAAAFAEAPDFQGLSTTAG